MGEGEGTGHQAPGIRAEDDGSVGGPGIVVQGGAPTGRGGREGGLDLERRVHRHLLRGLLIANVIIVLVVLMTGVAEFGKGQMRASLFIQNGMAEWGQHEWIEYMNDRHEWYSMSKLLWFVVYLLVQCVVIVGARDFIRAREKRRQKAP